MNSLRHVLVTLLITSGVFAAVVFFSCNKNKCGSLTCQNAGSCISNICSCPTGYSGSSCETGWSDASIGTYKCSRSNCSPAVLGAQSWLSAVTKDATDGGFTIDISNFDNNNTTIVANIDTFQHITTSPLSGTTGINVTGSYSNGIISLHYTTGSLNGVGGYQCNMTMVKE